MASITRKVMQQNTEEFEASVHKKQVLTLGGSMQCSSMFETCIYCLWSIRHIYNIVSIVTAILNLQTEHQPTGFSGKLTGIHKRCIAHDVDQPQLVQSEVIGVIRSPRFVVMPTLFNTSGCILRSVFYTGIYIYINIYLFKCIRWSMQFTYDHMHMAATDYENAWSLGWDNNVGIKHPKILLIPPPPICLILRWHKHHAKATVSIMQYHKATDLSNNIDTGSRQTNVSPYNIWNA